MKKVLMPLAPGFEEVEALTVVDILRRAGAEVVIAGTVEGVITGRNGIHVVADAALDKCMDAAFDMVVLPGGAAGTENLKKDERVRRLIQRMNAEGRLVTAICAAPGVLSAAGLTKGKTITSHPSARAGLIAGRISEDRVVTDGNIITSQGPGTAMEFAFRLVEALFGPEKVKEVNNGVLARL
ncbi:MAG: DJ-1/PfpI family protein [Deltaproteobacteria bacterium]|nr:DJ-1/PfpI family protein [Deltaproteobacteria bacterium]